MRRELAKIFSPPLTPQPLPMEEVRSQPISRVLSWAIIPLGSVSPLPSSNLPGGGAGRTSASLFGLAPDGVCRAAGCCHLRGALLPHPFTLTGLMSGGLLSVALSVGFHRPGVTWHPALWSPDFPPTAGAMRDCLADSAGQWCGYWWWESRVEPDAQALSWLDCQIVAAGWVPAPSPHPNRRCRLDLSRR